MVEETVTVDSHRISFCNNCLPVRRYWSYSHTDSRQELYLQPA